MKTFRRNVCSHIRQISSIFLMFGMLLLWLYSCETEYIPNKPDAGVTTYSATEGNFSITVHFANYGDDDELPDTHSMTPETDIIPLGNNQMIYATLAVDNVDGEHPVRTRALEPNARIRVVVYDSAAVFTRKMDVLYRDSDNFLVNVDNPGYKINLEAGHYKLVAYSYNTTADPPVIADTLKNIDSGNDLIWGVSPTVAVPEGVVTPIPITLYHKMSQVKVVAKMRDGSPGISAFSGASTPGYTANMVTFSGELSKNTAIPLTFTFPTVAFPVDSIASNTRTVYTGGDIPTIIYISSMRANDTTLVNIPATFAKALKSGYSYTMTMEIGDSPEITDDTPPPGMTMWVGAFWKALETGERLIRIPVTHADGDSVWTAQVIEGRDWIVLDTLASTDLNIWTPTAEIGNDAGHHLLSTPSTFVSGFARMGGDPADDDIYFRIGLTSPYTPTDQAPARYGMVLLTYGHNRLRHRIWIRQGDDPDYLMRPQDMGGAESWGSPDPRPLARKFSPYNLTADNLDAQVDIPGTLPAVNPGKFTDYPTQTGAYFQWANFTYQRYAWNPNTPTITSYVWNSGTVLNQFWNTLGSTYESCPPGYRRPGDGTISGYDNPFGDLAISESAQSLFFNSTIHNVRVGYYADGFFDRLPIVATPTGTAAGSVSIGNEQIAYKGIIIFNPLNFASLFLPESGYRQQTDGILLSTGTQGVFQTNATSSNNNTVKITNVFSGLSIDTSVGGAAVTVRCIKDDAPVFRISRESFDVLSSPYYAAPNKLMTTLNSPAIIHPRETSVRNPYYITPAGGRSFDPTVTTYGTDLNSVALDYLVSADRIYISGAAASETYSWKPGNFATAADYLSAPATATTFNPATDGIPIGGTSANGNGWYTVLATNSVGSTVHAIQVANYRDGLSMARPKLIGNQAELDAVDDETSPGSGVSVNLTMHYELAGNISMTGVWIPLGTTPDDSFMASFRGSLYGNYYAINGLDVQKTVYPGLFGFLGDGARIEALGLTNVNINSTLTTGNSGAGALASSILDVISFTGSVFVSDCYVTGTITDSGADGAGGLIGTASLGTMKSVITRCYSGVTINKSNGRAGGIVGYIFSDRGLEDAVVSECYFKGNITSTTGLAMGGIVGEANNGATIKDCYSTGTLIDTYDNVADNSAGGILGKTGVNVLITRCFSTSSITGFRSGGITGILETGGTVSASVALNNSITGTTAGTIVGSNTGGTLSGNHIFNGVMLNSAFVPGADWNFTTATNLASYTGIGWSTGVDTTATWRMKTAAEISASAINANVPILSRLDAWPQPPLITDNCRPPATPGTMTFSPSNTVFGGQPLTISVPAVTGATSYTWNIPTGFTPTGNQTTTLPTITVTAPTTGSTFQAGRFTVMANNVCGSSANSSNTTNVNVQCAQPSAETITGQMRFEAGSTPVGITYTSSLATQQPGVNYVWTVPAGFTITSGQGTRSITVSVTTPILTPTTFAASNFGSVTLTKTSTCPGTPASVQSLGLFVCGAATGSGGSGYLCFRCSNMGPNQEDLTKLYTTTNFTNWYYQYGRSTPAVLADGTNFISNWNTGMSGWQGTEAQGPCPAGWKIPTEAQLQGILNNNLITDIPLNAQTGGNMVGQKIGDHLFLPFFGGNYVGGTSSSYPFPAGYVNERGYYWNMTNPNSSQGRYMVLYPLGTVFASNFGYGYQEQAMSIRCVKQ